jgi:hypothetical protein
LLYICPDFRGEAVYFPLLHEIPAEKIDSCGRVLFFNGGLRRVAMLRRPAAG